MEAYERKICRSVKHLIAVSEIDAARIRQMFGVDKVSSVRTGVDIDYFARRGDVAPVGDMVFCGSMDWLPNVDAVVYFLAEILPLIRKKLPGATFTIAGRSPDPKVLQAVEGLEGVSVTGRVEDMRPYLWGAKISVVPLRIGGGTRLKIYECMAAGVPVVSTSVGAEGLRYSDGEDIALADDARRFCRRLHSIALRRIGSILSRASCSGARSQRVIVGRRQPRVRGHPRSQSRVDSHAATVNSASMRVAVVTRYFPSSGEPAQGRSLYETLRVARPQRRCPGLLSQCRLSQVSSASQQDLRQAGPRFRLPDVSVSYFDYPALPLVSRPFNGWMAARTLLPSHSRLCARCGLRLLSLSRGLRRSQDRRGPLACR